MKKITDQQIEAWLEGLCTEPRISGLLGNIDLENAYKMGYLQSAFQSILNEPKRRRDYIEQITKGQQ